MRALLLLVAALAGIGGTPARAAPCDPQLERPQPLDDGDSLTLYQAAIAAMREDRMVDADRLLRSSHARLDQAKESAARALRPYILARLVEVALVRHDEDAAIGRLRVLRAALRRTDSHPPWIDAVMIRADSATARRQNTQAGSAISATCRAFGVATSDARITFDTASAAISAEARADLAQIAANLAANSAITAPGCRMRVRGHTDASGTDAINDPLSLARARSVVSALVAASPALSGHLVPEGAGSHEPLYPGSDPAAYALNRRVELAEACGP